MYHSLAIGSLPLATEPSRFGIQPLRRATWERAAECQNLEGFCILGSLGGETTLGAKLLPEPGQRAGWLVLA